MILPSKTILDSLSKQQQEELLQCDQFSEFKKIYKKQGIDGCSPHQFWRELQTQKFVSVSHFPISSKLKKFMYDAEMIDKGESRPQFYFSLCAISSLLLRYLASIHIQLYVELTQADEMDFNKRMVSIIERATDGQWQNICTEIQNYIKKSSRDQKETWKAEKPDLMALYDILFSFF